jgi:spore germination cell wall hydrolase CwlJ-like protein
MEKKEILQLTKRCNFMISIMQVLFLGFGLAMIGSVLTEVTKNKFSKLESENNQLVVSRADTATRTRQLTCLAKNIYWEASGESFEGKVAVAQVTLNRVRSPKFGNDVCDVVYQKNTFTDRIVCQFSWVCQPGMIVKPIHPDRYAESMNVAKKVLLENFRLDSVREALYYHADYVNPGWGMQPITKIGRHIFYKG